MLFALVCPKPRGPLGGPRTSRKPPQIASGGFSGSSDSPPGFGFGTVLALPESPGPWHSPAIVALCFFSFRSGMGLVVRRCWSGCIVSHATVWGLCNRGIVRSQLLVRAQRSSACAPGMASSLADYTVGSQVWVLVL